MSLGAELISKNCYDDLTKSDCLACFLSYPPEFKLPLKRIVSDPEMQEVLKTIEKQRGKIKIEVGDCGPNKAIYSLKNHSIKVSTNLMNDSEGNKVGYIVFEIFNAFQRENFVEIIDRCHCIEEFVKCFESVEYFSALNTKKIGLKILGLDEDFDLKYICSDFPMHYALNQITGHSEWIAHAYFPKEEYRGTLFHPLKELDDRDRKLLYALFYTSLKTDCKNLPIRDSASSIMTFEGIMTSLQKSVQRNQTYKKVLECAESIFSRREQT